MTLTKQFYKEAFGMGFIFWLIGYVLGIVFFMIMPKDMIGWAIMPIGIAITVWAVIKKVNGDSLKYYLIIALAWTLIAIIADYIFLVKALKPADGYYKLDVYLYYILTFAIPALVGWRKLASK